MLHEHFIPSERNSYQPHFLRFRVAAALLGVVLVLEALYLTVSFVIIPRSDYLAAIFATVLVDQTNEERVVEHLNGLTVNDKLVLAAQLKADDMAAQGYFSHNSPDGKTPWYWFKQAGYDYAAAGENLAVNFSDSKDVTDAWMRSESHRANIMSGNYTEIGIATARGTYKGKEAIFVVQEFGRPSLVARETTKSAAVVSVASSSTPTPVPQVKAIAKSPTTPTPPKSPVVTPKPSVVSPPVASSSPLPTPPPASLAASSSVVVAGAQTAKLDTATPAASAPILEPVETSVLNTLLASPRQATTTIYFLLASLLSLALGLAIFIKIRIQYPHIIANGVLLIAVILCLVLLNGALGFTQGVI